mmetsp:Transcript_38937/g.96250  ORF Transcript_38937/g.96250 Transcript_38937/m.96250 type:complete len:88 (+) Transcript_38937:789-1052(+)
MRAHTEHQAGQGGAADQGVGPSGVHVDVTAGFVLLPEAKRAHYFPLIDSWLAVTITRKVMQSLVGKLGWCCPIQPLCRGWCCRGWCW